ncbi:MAG TPA: aminotransferase class I/II-fold pyridoxal phosphate-dependent enzyme [Chloroflexota bacterium]|nr:aminotransferase class I/II-fold pyridoxal phosphate-dependent enzyme [Chloroflexota bacterium]
MGFQTDCTTTGEDREAYYGSVPPPIYESSLFTFPTFADFEAAFQSTDGRPVYTRGSNPTVRALEKKLALLERGEDARVFASGMAAIAAGVMSFAGSGDHVVAVRSIYNNAYRLLGNYLPRFGVETTFVDFTDLDAVERAIRPDTRLLYLESPGNPGMHLVDLPATVDLARRHNLPTMIDNSMATPYNQRPLDYGIDLVVHSATKYLAGHSDVVAGALIGTSDAVNRVAANELRDLGGIIGPFEAWLILRGIRTLGLRMKAHNDAGLRVATWLAAHPRVLGVNYAGLRSHPQHDLAQRQMSGFSGLLSFVIDGGRDAATRLVDHLHLFGIAVSWGGFESLALPMTPDPGAPPEMTTEVGLVPGLVRLSIGLEDVDDLLADLDQALARA